MKIVQKSRQLIREELECVPALRRFGSGWISGVIGVILGIASLGLVLVMRFPGIFGAVEFSALRAGSGFRVLLFGLMLTAYVSALLSLILREKKVLGSFGLILTLIAWLSFGPARALFDLTTGWSAFREWVSSWPIVLQIVLIMFLTDLVQYWLHRAFHRIPLLWRFHAVHHSAKAMDWMAGARMHFLEILVLRGTTVLPMILLGFSQDAVNIYILIVYLMATFAHSNIGWRFKWLDRWLVTPRFHHWHHGIEKEAIDINFAIHFPWLDRLFGTHHLPKDRWPEGYGISGHPVPTGYWKQWWHPFKRKK